MTKPKNHGGQKGVTRDERAKRREHLFQCISKGMSRPEVRDSYKAKGWVGPSTSTFWAAKQVAPKPQPKSTVTLIPSTDEPMSTDLKQSVISWMRANNITMVRLDGDRLVLTMHKELTI